MPKKMVYTYDFVVKAVDPQFGGVFGWERFHEDDLVGGEAQFQQGRHAAVGFYAVPVYHHTVRGAKTEVLVVLWVSNGVI